MNVPSPLNSVPEVPEFTLDRNKNFFEYEPFSSVINAVILELGITPEIISINLQRIPPYLKEEELTPDNIVRCLLVRLARAILDQKKRTPEKEIDSDMLDLILIHPYNGKLLKEQKLLISSDQNTRTSYSANILRGLFYKLVIYPHIWDYIIEAINIHYTMTGKTKDQAAKKMPKYYEEWLSDRTYTTTVDSKWAGLEEEAPSGFEIEPFRPQGKVGYRLRIETLRSAEISRES